MSTLRILAPVRYPWRFNSPKQSRHDLEIRYFLPFNKITPKLEGFTVFGTSPFAHFDLIHAFNRIPIGKTPFVIGCEAHLPRAFGLEGTSYYRLLNGALASDRCRRIVAISKHAYNVMQKQHAEDANWQAIVEKTEIRYPNMVMPEGDDLAPISLDPVRLVFVGSHFGRKGGAVAVKIAERALSAGFPLHLTIISDLQVGGSVWTDPTDRALFEPYFRLFDLPNVERYGNLNNADVRKHLSKAHFSILTTFSDTFGYSAIESMAHHTPVIATKQGALPEFIEHLGNGVLLDLETNDVSEWIAIDRDHSSPEFVQYYVDEIERLANDAFDYIVKITSSPDQYREMRRAARATAVQYFNHIDANIFWDNLYGQAVEGNRHHKIHDARIAI